MDRDTPRNIPDDELDEHLEQAFGARAPVPQPPDARASLAVLRSRLEVVGPRVRSGARVSWGWRSVAGGVALVGVVAAAGIGGSRLVPFTRAQPVREFASALGSRAAITLRDGTRLVLGPGTHLHIPASFGQSDRMVELDGEASFTVVHDERHPFAVRTPRALIRDVGTVFTVRAYRGDPSDRVVVQEGQVLLAACTDRPVAAHRPDPSTRCPSGSLSRGDIATIDDTATTKVHRSDVASYFVWVQGGLAFNDALFEDVVRELSRTFGLEISVADSALLSQRVTGEFADVPPDEILNEVTRVVGARYDRAGRRVVIHRQTTKAVHPDRDSPPPLHTALAHDPTA